MACVLFFIAIIHETLLEIKTDAFERKVLSGSLDLWPDEKKEKEKKSFLPNLSLFEDEYLAYQIMALSICQYDGNSSGQSSFGALVKVWFVLKKERKALSLVTLKKRKRSNSAAK